MEMVRLTSFQTHRDGGSVSTSFAGTDGCEYTLKIPWHRFHSSIDSTFCGVFGR